MPSDWLIPEWPAPAGVHAFFTTRHGGTSARPYDSMNLGDHVGDAADAVEANRALLRKQAGAHAVFLKQVHGHHIVELDGATPDGVEADAATTQLSGVACTIMVADCLPVLLASEDGMRVAAAHAGWRGLAGEGHSGILEEIFVSFNPLAQAGRGLSAIKTIAWLGPCIGPTAFEVGPEVKAAFEAVQAASGDCFVATGAGKYLADLPALARLRLQALGINEIYGNDGSDAWCTVRNASLFFSHRRDAGIHGNGFGTTGRMAACIWRD